MGKFQEFNKIYFSIFARMKVASEPRIVEFDHPKDQYCFYIIVIET